MKNDIAIKESRRKWRRVGLGIGLATILGFGSVYNSKDEKYTIPTQEPTQNTIVKKNNLKPIVPTTEYKTNNVGTKTILVIATKPETTTPEITIPKTDIRKITTPEKENYQPQKRSNTTILPITATTTRQHNSRYSVIPDAVGPLEVRVDDSVLESAQNDIIITQLVGSNIQKTELKLYNLDENKNDNDNNSKNYETFRGKYQVSTDGRHFFVYTLKSDKTKTSKLLQQLKAKTQKLSCKAYSDPESNVPVSSFTQKSSSIPYYFIHDSTENTNKLLNIKSDTTQDSKLQSISSYNQNRNIIDNSFGNTTNNEINNPSQINDIVRQYSSVDNAQTITKNTTIYNNNNNNNLIAISSILNPITIRPHLTTKPIDSLISQDASIINIMRNLRHKKPLKNNAMTSLNNTIISDFKLTDIITSRINKYDFGIYNLGDRNFTDRYYEHKFALHGIHHNSKKSLSTVDAIIKSYLFA